MYSVKLKMELRELSINFAEKNNLDHIKPIPASAFLYKKREDNFHRQSWKNIQLNRDWKNRTEKPHSDKKRRADFEMQSSNSSDALLMNIFSHPKISSWKGIANLFGVSEIIDIKYGYNPDLTKEGKLEERPTEIDLFLNGDIICEAKLTEGDFTEKVKTEVEKYDDFKSVFNTECLSQNSSKYNNYQLIRNILAIKEYNKFFLICDGRRPDLVREFYRTVRCIKDISLRNKCDIIFWQDITKVVGKDLKKFLAEKYGL